MSKSEDYSHVAPNREHQVEIFRSWSCTSRILHMQARYRLYRRSNRSHGTYYAQDSTTGARESLGTKNKAEALKLLQAKNDAQSQPVLSRRAWPKIRYASRHGITREQHEAVLRVTPNKEYRIYFEFLLS